MGKGFNIPLENSMRAKRSERGTLRERMQFDQKPGRRARLRGVASSMATVFLFFFGFFGGFVVVLYGVPIPGFTRLP